MKDMILQKIAKAEKLTVELIANPETQTKTAHTLLAVLEDIRKMVKEGDKNERTRTNRIW